MLVRVGDISKSRLTSGGNRLPARLPADQHINLASYQLLATYTAMAGTESLHNLGHLKIELSLFHCCKRASIGFSGKTFPRALYYLSLTTPVASLQIYLSISSCVQSVTATFSLRRRFKTTPFRQLLSGSFFRLLNVLDIIAMNFRRRLSSIVTPLAGSQAVQSGTLVESRYVNEKSGRGEDELTSPSDDSSRKSYDLSDAASQRSFDTSDAGSDAASDDDSQALSGSDDSWDAEDEESEVGDKYDLMASHLYQIAEGKGWFRSSKAWGNSTGIVSIRQVEPPCASVDRVIIVSFLC
jgi:hypothetical protein